MESKPAETRLNYFKNFNHFNKNQLGAMEIFAPRSNNEIQRILKDIEDFKTDDEETEEEQVEDFVNNNDVGEGGIESEEGLSMNNNEPIIHRSHSYPYGFGSTPMPTFSDKTGIRSKTSRQMLTFESFKNSQYRK